MTSYEVVTAKGAPIKTFDTERKARAYAASIKDRFPGCAVFSVTSVEPIRERVYTPRRVAA